MRTRFILALFLLVISGRSLWAQYETVVLPTDGSKTIEIASGKVMHVTNFIGISASASLTKDGVTRSVLQAYSTAGSTGFRDINTYFAGPATLQLTSTSGGGVTLSYRLFENSNVAVTTPSNAVVIPADAAGPVNIILESSVDLVTWTPATPGAYGASTAKRFFRVRAVNQ